MSIYFPYRLDCQNLLVVEAIDQLRSKWTNTNRGFTFSVQFTRNTKLILDQELSQKKLPAFFYATCFARPAKNQQSIHVDGTGGTTHASLNIPLMGCENSMMEWFSGSYQVVKKNYIDQSGQTIHFQEVIWSSDPTVVAALELRESHWLRVDVPHRTTANDTELRAVLCLRLVGNPTWDQVCSIAMG